MKYLIHLLVAVLITTGIAWSGVITPASSPGVKSGGQIPSASDWNTAVVGIYTYINNNIVSALNTLTTKGDLYVYSGTSLMRFGVGSNGQIVQAASGQPAGMSWVAAAGTDAVTTKGDLTGCDGESITRTGVGTNDYVVTADSTQTSGLSYTSITALTDMPQGAVIAWSPAGAGTTTIPAGWLVCDGTSSTPNLIGLFIVGTRPNGSSATPATGGFGAQMVDARGAGAATHQHIVTINATTAAATGNTSNAQSGSAVTIPTAAHTHVVTQQSGACGTASSQPAAQALIYIIKQ